MLEPGPLAARPQEYHLHMKYGIAFFLIAVATARASGQGAVNATISNFSNNKGVCRACIFNNAEGFKKSTGAVACAVIPISGKTAMVSFKNLPAGSYAISVFHDANNNNRFDTNFLGIPKEGYGASGNNLPFASAPTFSANKFDLTSGQVNLNIRLRNL